MAIFQSVACTECFIKNQRKGDFITWGVPIFFFFIQNGANFAQPLLWVPRTRPQRKNFKKNIFDLLFGPFKKVIFCSFYAFPGGT